METQQVSEAESVREQLQDLQEQIAAHKMARQEAEAELERQKQVKNSWKLIDLSYFRPHVVSLVQRLA